MQVNHNHFLGYTKDEEGKPVKKQLEVDFICNKGSKKYFAYPSVTTEKDLDGNIVTTTRQFSSSYGYMTEEKADFGDNMYKTVQYGNYILAGKSYRPRLITRTQRHTDDASTFTQKTSIVYDEAIGYKKKVIENYGSSLPLTTEYTYDTWGNVLSSTNSGTGITALTQYYTYDFSKRFVAGTHTSPSSAIKDYTYDIWGNVLTETDLSDSSNRLITKHFYDGWGNREKTILPDGRRMEYETGWKRGRPTQRFFTLTQGTGQPWVITHPFISNRKNTIHTFCRRMQITCTRIIPQSLPAFHHLIFRCFSQGCHIRKTMNKTQKIIITLCYPGLLQYNL